MSFILEDRDSPKLDLAAEALRRCGTVRLRVWGTSMLPSVWPGDLLTIQSAGFDEIVPGDIVLVLRGNRPFVHRLIQKQGAQDSVSWITKGDAMPHNDPPATASQLLGRVACIRRANRSFVPSRRTSQFHFALAWTLFRWARFRTLMLRIHAAVLRSTPTRAGIALRAVFGVRGIAGTSTSPTSHP